MGGLGGDGGNGGRGSHVVIHTDDPAMLRLVEVNVSGGRGGTGGGHGLPGVGGLGGPGGMGGKGGVYAKPCLKVDDRGKVYSSQVDVVCADGKMGKYGKMGKAGKRRTGKPSRNGKDGEYGTVSFCIYNEQGLCESGGTPYRLMFPRKQMRVLKPLSLPFRASTPPIGSHGNVNSTLFLYGGKLRFGPVAPMNVGGLSCPTSQLCARLLFGADYSSVISSKLLTFPPIPAAQSTNYGELPVSQHQEIELMIPGMMDACFGHKQIDPSVWPWQESTAPFNVRISAVFRIHMEMESIPFSGNPDLDGDLVCTRDYEVTVDVPLELVSSPTVPLKNVEGPASIALGDTAPHTFSFGVRNKLPMDTITEEGNPHKCVLRVVASGFKPTVTSSNDSMVEQSFPSVEGHQLNAYELAVNDIAPDGCQMFSFDLHVKEGLGPELGALVHIRSELYNSEGIVECSPAKTIRVAPAAPQTRGEVTTKDVLFISNATMTPPDFQLLTLLCTALGMRAHFLDCQHDYTLHSKVDGPPAGRGVDGTAHTVSAALWKQFQGKCTLVWLPASTDHAGAIPQTDLQQHLDQGGSLICSARVPFAWARSLTAAPDLVSRRFVVTSNAISLGHMSDTEQVTSTHIKGVFLSTLVMNIVLTMSTTQKLEYIQTAGKSLGLFLGDTSVQNFFIAEAGLCSCFSKPKIAPVGDTVFNVRDCVAAALRNDISIDAFYFDKYCSVDSCFALQAVVKFFRDKIATAVSKADVVDVACIISSALVVTGVNDKNRFSGPALKKWKRLGKDLVEVQKKCTTVGSRSFYTGGVKSFAARLHLLSPVGEDKYSTTRRHHRLNDQTVMGFLAQ